jgi:hypothetical protein
LVSPSVIALDDRAHLKLSEDASIGNFMVSPHLGPAVEEGAEDVVHRLGDLGVELLEAGRRRAVGVDANGSQAAGSKLGTVTAGAR